MNVQKEVPPFYVKDGKVVKSLQELVDTIPTISDTTFEYHVNSNKNDFATWIKEGLGDPALADSIKRVKTKKGLLQKLKNA